VLRSFCLFAMNEQKEKDAGESFEEQLARLNREEAKKLVSVLDIFDRRLIGLEPLEAWDKGKDKAQVIRDGHLHSMKTPASVEEWRTAYPELCSSESETPLQLLKH